MNLTDFETLFKQMYKPLYWFSYNITRDVNVSKDIVHDAFIKLWNKRFFNINNYNNYLYKIISNDSIKFITKTNKNVPIDNIINDNNFITNNNYDNIEKEVIIRNAIDQLPPRCKTIFILSKFEQKKYSEIAEILGISVKTVENQMCIALATLRTKLKHLL